MPDFLMEMNKWLMYDGDDDDPSSSALNRER